MSFYLAWLGLVLAWLGRNCTHKNTTSVKTLRTGPKNVHKLSCIEAFLSLHSIAPCVQFNCHTHSYVCTGDRNRCTVFYGTIYKYMKTVKHNKFCSMKIVASKCTNIQREKSYKTSNMAVDGSCNNAAIPNPMRMVHGERWWMGPPYMHQKTACPLAHTYQSTHTCLVRTDRPAALVARTLNRIWTAIRPTTGDVI